VLLTAERRRKHRKTRGKREVDRQRSHCAASSPSCHVTFLCAETDREELAADSHPGQDVGGAARPIDQRAARTQA